MKVNPRMKFIPLGEVVDFSPRFGKDKLADDSLASFIPMKCVEEESGRFESLGDRKVAELRKGYTPFRDGDVIFAKVTPCMENGKAAVLKGLTNGVGFGSTEFFALRPKNGLDAHYLFHFILQSNFRRDAARNMTGAVGLRRVPKQWLEQQTIPLPEPDEQRKIVAEIEKQFTRLEAGVAALRRVQANLKRYRAAVLKAACEGRLVPTEAELYRKLKTKNSKLETGAQLLARILTERRQNWQGRGKYKEPAAPDTANLPSLPDGWTWASLEQIAWSSSYGTSAKCSPDNSGPPVLRIPNIAGGRIDLTDLKYAGADESIDAGDELAPGDLLIIRTNGSKNLIGRSTVVREKPNRATSYASYLIRFRLFGSTALFDWVGTIWDVSFLRAWIEQRAATSAGQHNISMSVLSTLPIPLPPLAEQTRIVAEVERRLSVVEELESV